MLSLLGFSPEFAQFLRSIFYIGSGIWLIWELRSLGISKRVLVSIGITLHIFFVSVRAGATVVFSEFPFVWQDVHDITILLTYVLGFVQLRLGGFRPIPRIGRNENS